MDPPTVSPRFGHSFHGLPLATTVLVVTLIAVLGLGSCRRSHENLSPAPDGRVAPADSPPAEGLLSGLPASLRLRELDDKQRRMICDWNARQYGGYGNAVICGDGRVTSRVPKDWPGCVASFQRLRCDITVGEHEACTLASAKDVCASVKSPPPACMVDGC